MTPEFRARNFHQNDRRRFQLGPPARSDLLGDRAREQPCAGILQAQTSFGAIMETVANAYGIPSIDLGVKIARREKAGELVFKSDAATAGKLVFSRDGVHPGNEGHDLYRDMIARSMLAMKNNGQLEPHQLPRPLEARCWESAGLLPMARAVLSPGWKAVDARTDAVYRDDLGRTDAMLRGSEAQPLRTIGRAAALVQPGDVVRIHAGVYRESVVIKQSGTKEQPIRFEAVPKANVVVTGADLLTGWRRETGEDDLFSGRRGGAWSIYGR